MGKKSILFIYGPLGAGGAERVLIDILHNLDFTKYEVDLAIICAGGPLMKEIPSEVNIIELWPGYSLNYKLAYRISIWLRCNWLLSRKMNGQKIKKKYDLEISFLEGMPTKLGALRKSNSKKAAWVHVDLYNYPYESNQFYSGEENKVYNKFNYIINVSKDCELAFNKRFPSCNAIKKVIYNPIDKEKIIKLSNDKKIDLLKDDKKVIMMVGRITTQKNPMRFLEVAEIAKMNKLSLKFMWVGDGPLYDQIKQLVQERDLNDYVSLLGYIENPFPYLKQADILMVPSEYEGFCLVICEAMCLKVPVISTKTSGPTEIIGKNEYGRLTELSAQSLYNALTYLLEHPSEMEKIRGKGFERVECFSVKNTIQEIESLF